MRMRSPECTCGRGKSATAACSQTRTSTACGPEDRARRYTFEGGDPSAPQTLVALDGDTLLGFATISTAPKTDLAGVAELSALHVNSDAWDAGLAPR